MRDDSLPKVHHRFLEFGQMRQALSNKICWRVKKS
jgi:hypothetical protein